jgi:hypothetical protein
VIEFLQPLRGVVTINVRQSATPARPRRDPMMIFKKKIKAAVLTAAIALGILFGSTERSQATYYESFYSYYQRYYSC